MYRQFSRLGRGMGSHLKARGIHRSCRAQELGSGDKREMDWGGHRPKQTPPGLLQNLSSEP